MYLKFWILMTSLSHFTFMHWRRKWQPTQCSCLENPRNGGAWWAAVYGVAQSRIRLKWFSSSSFTVDPWTTPQLGTLTLGMVKNLNITYSPLSTYAVPLYPSFHIWGFNQLGVMHYCKTYHWKHSKYKSENTPSISGHAQLKSVSLKDQSCRSFPVT